MLTQTKAFIHVLHAKAKLDQKTIQLSIFSPFSAFEPGELGSESLIGGGGGGQGVD